MRSEESPESSQHDISEYITHCAYRIRVVEAMFRRRCDDNVEDNIKPGTGYGKERNFQVVSTFPHPNHYEGMDRDHLFQISIQP